MTAPMMLEIGLVAVGGLFLVAASYKVSNDGSLSSTIEALGITRSIAHALAQRFAYIESAFVFAVFLTPWPVAAAVLGAAGVVAVTAGWRASRLPGHVDCNCFGADHSAPLGLRQVFLGLLLLLLGGAMWLSSPRRISIAGAGLALTLMSSAVTAVRLTTSVPRVVELVRLRRLFSLEYPA